MLNLNKLKFWENKNINRSPNKKRLSCLLVDNNDTHRFIIKNLMEKNDILVEEITNGIELINMIKSSDKQFNIILIDLKIPQIDALSCVRILRNELDYKGIILGLTGCNDIQTIKECTNAKMNDLVVDPLTEEKILQLVNKFQEIKLA
jgi:CheY-like chemotaxis protein